MKKSKYSDGQIMAYPAGDCVAICRKGSTNWVCGDRDARQPTARLSKVSITKATYTKLCHVETYVKSLTYSVFGAGARNCRFTLSRGMAAPCRALSSSAVCHERRLECPTHASVVPLCSRCPTVDIYIDERGPASNPSRRRTTYGLARSDA